MSVPPFIVCSGIRSPNAKGLCGAYEYRGAVEGRPCYHQCGISGGNYIWFTEDALEGPMWVATPKEVKLGGAPEKVIARSPHLARWPWEVENWSVCGRDATFIQQPKMRFSLPNPAAEILVTLPAGRPGSFAGTVTAKYHAAGFLNNRPAFQGADNVEPAGCPRGLGGSLRLFWMPNASRWMIGIVQEGGGVQNMVARSVPDDGSSWASLWPWEAANQNWEVPNDNTKGLEDGEAKWFLDNGIHVKLSSPGLYMHCEDDPTQGGDGGLQGFYEPKGMTNGRVFYMQKLRDSELAGFTGAKCLWFAEDRGQWVVTTANLLGNSRTVLARIHSRAWWPWEAHLGGTTSPQSMGSTPFACLPPWHGGTTVLASSRADWEVADEAGEFHQAPSTQIELDPNRRSAGVKAGENAKYPWAGAYTRAGILSARPFFLQSNEEKKKKKKDKNGANKNNQPARAWAWHPPTTPRYAIWYVEDLEQWVITEDFRLLDSLTVDARVSSSAWYPWEATGSWQVSDGAGSFMTDPQLCVEETE